MHHPINSPAEFRIPPVIKRNITLFALSQSFTGTGMSMAYGLGPLMVIALTDSPSLAGLSVGLIGLSRFLVAYPIGKIMDVYGRKPGILLGLTLALMGAVGLGTSMTVQSLGLLLAGVLVLGMGMNAAQQLRVAATDMFPPHRRAQALGYVALGSLAGLAVAPLVISAAEALAHASGHHPLGLPWLFLPLLIVPGMILVGFVRPDPKEIGMHLDRYYPDYKPPERVSAAQNQRFSALSLLRRAPIRMAITANCAAQGNMAVIMVLTSLMLHHHGHSLSAIAFSHMFHSAGMFAFTIPLGKLADRIGREKVMFPGVATAMIGAGFVTFPDAYWSITLGTFLVGLGWAAANVAATALIADQSETTERGRAVGVSDSFAGAIAVLMAALTGPVIAYSGLQGAGLTAILVSCLPALLLPSFIAKRRLPDSSRG